MFLNKIESSTRPFVDIEIISDNKGKDTLAVENKGQFPIINVPLIVDGRDAIQEKSTRIISDYR